MMHLDPSQYMQAIVQRFLDELDVDVDPFYLSESLSFHPLNPSLQAITDTLDDMRIANLTMQLDQIHLQDLEGPFIAQLTQDRLAVVIEISEQTVKTWEPEAGCEVLSLETFRGRWTSIAIFAETTDYTRISSGTFYEERRLLTRMQKISLTTGSTLILGTSLYTAFSLLSREFTSWCLLLLIHLLGLGLCVALYQKERGSDHAFWDRLCNMGRRIQCQPILSSKGAYLLPWLKVTDLGMIYYSTGTLLSLLLLASPSPNFLFQCLAVGNLLALPYTLFSLYYQGFVAKTWCLMCTAIQILLWIEGGLLFSYLKGETSPTLIDFLFLSLGVGIPIIGFWGYKLLVVSIESRVRLKAKLQLYARSPEVRAGLSQRALEASDPIMAGEIVIEDPDNEARHTLIIVLSPSCPHCGKAFHELMGLYSTRPSEIQVVVRLLQTGYKEELSCSWARFLLSTFKQAGSMKVIRRLEDWYSQEKKDSHEWLKAYAQEEEKRDDAQIETILAYYRAWQEKISITHTPFLLVNGQPLPTGFSYEEIGSFLGE